MICPGIYDAANSPHKCMTNMHFWLDTEKYATIEGLKMALDQYSRDVDLCMSNNDSDNEESTETKRRKIEEY